MPALAPVPTTSTHTTATNGTAVNGHSRKKPRPNRVRVRVVKRRGRGKTESDEEEQHPEYESQSDSGHSHSSASSSHSDSDSDSDSDTEPASEDVLPSDLPGPSRTSATIPRVLTPSTTNVTPGFGTHGFGHSGAGNWGDMVAEEDSVLPVIDFSELSKQPDESEGPMEPEPEQQSTRRQNGSLLRGSTRPSARQAYQQRLETDPSYVPTVGEFWGHDDRLLDKGLRSLSGWWRGRWQGGYRGRGRGRGGFFGRAAAEPELDAPPVDRAWTHDGFEELKRSNPGAGRGGGGFRGGGRGGSTIRSSAPEPTQTPSQPQPQPPARVWFTKKPEHMWTKQAESFLYADFYKSRNPSVRVKLPKQKSAAVRINIRGRLTSLGSLSDSSSATPPAPESDYSDKVLVVNLPKSVVKEVVEEEREEEPSIEDVFTVRPRLVSPKLIPLPEHSHHRSVSITVSPIIAQKLQLPQPQMHDKSSPARWIQTEEAVLRHPTGTPPDDHSQSQPVFSPSHLHSPSYNAGSPSYGSASAYGGAGSPYQYAPPLPLPLGVALNPAGMPYEVATGRPVYLPPPYGNTPPPLMMQPVPVQSSFIPGHVHHHSAVSSDFEFGGTPPLNPSLNGGYVPEYTSPHAQPGGVLPSLRPPLFSFPRSSRIQIRAPDGSVRELTPAGTAVATAGDSSENKEADEYRKQAQEQQQAQSEWQELTERPEPSPLSDEEAKLNANELRLRSDAPAFEPSSASYFPPVSSEGQLQYPPLGSEGQYGYMQYNPNLYQNQGYYPEAYPEYQEPPQGYGMGVGGYNPYLPQQGASYDYEYEMYSQQPQGTVYYR